METGASTEPRKQRTGPSDGLPRYAAVRIYIGIATVASWILGGGLVLAGLIGMFRAGIGSLLAGAAGGFLLWLAIRVGADLCQAIVDVAENTRARSNAV
jgi:uncharacterized membrane protein